MQTTDYTTIMSECHHDLEDGHTTSTSQLLNARFNLYQHVNWLLCLRDATLNKKFVDFSLNQQLVTYPIVISVVMTFMTVFFIVLSTRSLEHEDFRFVVSLAIFAGLVTLVGFGLAALYYQRAKFLSNEDYKSADHIRNILLQVSNFYVIVIEVFAILFALTRSSSSICRQHGLSEFDSALHYIFCGNFSTIGYSYSAVVLLLSAPVISSAILPSVDIRLIWLQSLASIAVFIGISVVYNRIPSAMLLIEWALINIFVVASLQTNKIKAFLLFNRLEELIRENEKHAEQFHVSEMRYLIANVAHDLKSPLMSFTSALDFLAHSSGELQEQFADHDKTPLGDVDDCQREQQYLRDLLKGFLLNVENCLQGLRETNAFMLMTINRCVDYAKAAKGVQLVPHYETVNLDEVISLPLTFTRNIQTRVKIELCPLASTICRNVITDKQWLQENLLCLLSNAVKYSSDGVVTLRVSLVDETPSSAINSLPSSDNVAAIDSKSNSKPTSKGESHVVTTRRPHLLFEVEDCGIGVPSDARTYLFKPFRQAQRLTGGTGLGLYSLAKREEAIQGRYGLHNRPDGRQGTVFWFSIPYRPDTLAACLDLDRLHSHSRSDSSVEGTPRTDIFSCNSRDRVSISSTSQTPRVNLAVHELNGGSRGSPVVPPLPIGAVPDSVGSDQRSSALKDHSPRLPSHSGSSEEKNQDVFIEPNHSRPNATHVSPSAAAAIAAAVAAASSASNSSSSGGSSTPASLSATVDHSSSDGTLRPPQLARGPSTRALNVLLVDDSLAIVKMTSMMLRKLGHNITTAENGEVAVREVDTLWTQKRQSFDVILMDLQMPVMDGLEATKRIRGLESGLNNSSNDLSNLVSDSISPSGVESLQVQADRVLRESKLSASSLASEDSKSVDSPPSSLMNPLPKQFIVCVSANSDPETESAAIECGADAFMPKPFTISSFIQMVNGQG